MKANFTPSFDEEKFYWNSGTLHVIGIDEVGRGCFAGPLVVAGVIFQPTSNFEWLSKIHDSKLLSCKLRETLSPLIQKHCLHFSIATIDVPTINKIGIGKATYMGMRKIVKVLEKKVGNSTVAILVDAFTIPNIKLKQKAMIKGDQKSISIAAASIIAKVYRDDLMNKLAKKYIMYGFEKNKGYGTKMHRKAIRSHGLSDIHRTSFNLGGYL